MKKFNLILIISVILLLIGFYLDNSVINIISKNRSFILINFFILLSKYYYFLAVLVALFCILKKDKESLINICLASLFSLVGVYILKEIIKRPRPVLSLIEATNYSFPSGHATFMFALLVVIWYGFKQKYIKYSWLILSVIVAFSRIYLNVHYFTDVIGGLIFGLIIGKSIIKIRN